MEEQVNNAQVETPQIEIEQVTNLPEKERLQQGFKSEAQTIGVEGQKGETVAAATPVGEGEKPKTHLNMGGLKSMITAFLGILNKRAFEYEMDSDDKQTIDQTWDEYLKAKGLSMLATNPELALVGNHLVVEAKAIVHAATERKGVFKPKPKKGEPSATSLQNPSANPSYNPDEALRQSQEIMRQAQLMPQIQPPQITATQAPPNVQEVPKP
jgi:hypothetical protein